MNRAPRPAEEVLAAALKEAVEELDDMVPYVSDYFRAKWGYDETIARLRSVLESFSYMPIPYEPEECPKCGSTACAQDVEW